MVVVGAFALRVLIAVGRGDVLDRLDLGSCYWGVFFAALLAGFSRRAWFGYTVRDVLAAAVRGGRRSAGELVIDLRSGELPSPLDDAATTSLDRRRADPLPARAADAQIMLPNDDARG
jgi:hypothetical protein